MLLRLVPALLVASPVSLVGQDAPAVAPEPPRKAIPGFDIFKDGGELHDVMIPRYDASFRLLSVLKAKRITVVDESRLESDAVAIELYHPKTGGSRGRVDLEKAFLDQRSQILSSAGPVNFSSEKLSGNGHGLIHSIFRPDGHPFPEPAHHRDEHKAHPSNRHVGGHFDYGRPSAGSGASHHRRSGGTGTGNPQHCASRRVFRTARRIGSSEP
jgi:hypothetical protein